MEVADRCPRGVWVVQLRNLRLENFKKFEKLELELRPFQLLVGPNNSGKSTVLQACALLDFCFRICLDVRNGQYALKNRTLSTDQFSVIPVANPRDLWLNRKLEKKGKLVEIRLEADFGDSKRLSFRISFSHNRFNIRPEETSHVPAPDEFRIALIPGFTGFLPQEEKRTPAIQRDMKAHGQHGGIIRNILLDLKEKPDAWSRFVQVLGRVFPQIHLRQPEFDEQVDRYIRVQYDEELENGGHGSAGRKPPMLDLFAAGSGFHQFVQIFAGMYLEKATTVLFDEPDAHLYGKLQTELHAVLIDLTKENRQVIAATHSSELICTSEPHQIISFGNGKPGRLNAAPEMLSVVRHLGAVDNLALVLIDAHRRVVVVEDRSDEHLLRLWLQRILGLEYANVNRRLVFLRAHRRPSGDDVNLMLDAIVQAFRAKTRQMDVHALVVADRDYRSTSETKAELDKYQGEHFRRQTWHVWDRVEIENYLLIPEAIASALREIVESAQGQLFADSASEVVAWLEEIVEAERETVVKRVADSIQAADRGLRASTAFDKAGDYVDPLWTGASRYRLVDAKERVLPSLRHKIQERFACNLSDAAIIRAVTDQDIPGDIRTVIQELKQFVGL